MVTDKKENSRKTSATQGAEHTAPEPNKINASTPYDFSGKNLTPYGGLLPVITMLENLGFRAVVEQTLTSKRIPRAMDLYRSCWASCSACTSALHGCINCVQRIAGERLKVRLARKSVLSARLRSRLTITTGC
jgi:hypothetical protein